MKELLSRDPSLNEVLAALGYTKRKKDSSLGKHELYKDDRLVFTGHTGDIWEWLKNIGERDRGVALVQIAIAYDSLQKAAKVLSDEVGAMNHAVASLGAAMEVQMDKEKGITA